MYNLRNQQTFTCSKSATALKKGGEICSKLTIKTQVRRQ